MTHLTLAREQIYMIERGALDALWATGHESPLMETLVWYAAIALGNWKLAEDEWMWERGLGGASDL